MELELARRGIPFVKYGGGKFLAAAHIKDVLSVLRWAENPRNRIAGFRAVRLLPGVGPTTATKILNALDAAPDAVSALAAFKVPPSATADWSTFLGVFRILRAQTPNWPVDLELVSRWYEPHLQRTYDDATVRRGDLDQLQEIASTFPSRERFLTEVTLDPPEGTSGRAGDPGQDDDCLVLSTIHSSKGQEWKAVYILNVVDGCIPSGKGTGTSEEVEEERRLLYVAMTRAKLDLHLIVPQRLDLTKQSAHGDRHVYVPRSRFIPDALTTAFETCAWPDATTAMARPQGPRNGSGPVINIAERVRSHWGSGLHQRNRNTSSTSQFSPTCSDIKRNG